MTFKGPGSLPHDPAYLRETPGQQDPPKEYFKAVTSLIRARYADRELTLLDVGCAAGAFLQHAVRVLNVRESAGLDSSDELLRRAQDVLPDTTLVCSSIEATRPMGDRQFDVVTCLGVMSILDEFETILERLWALVLPGGSLYIFDLLNPDAVDVVMRFRPVGPEGPGEWRSGFNVRCLDTYTKAVAALNPKPSAEWHDFEMPFAIAKQAPLRAWTMQTELRPHQVVVGTGQLLTFVVVEIHKPS